MKYLLLLLTVCFLGCHSANVIKSNAAKTFSNPLLPSGADPWSMYKDGFYYYTHTLGDSLVIWKTKNLAELATAEHKTIWIPEKNKAWSKQLWAPEIHYVRGKWYVYFAADDGKNDNHRLYAVENSSKDPMMGSWTFKGKVADASDKWAIDGSVFEEKGRLYMIWSGWEGNANGRQDLYIARMVNPWTIDGPRVRLSSPTYEWERNGDLNDANNRKHVDVNEGPQILQRNNQLFLVYSASGCWTDHYALGMLSISAGSNLLDSASWTKSPEPVFKASPENSVYAPGHNSFFKSPNGKEDWILYHANAQPGQGCGRHRSPRAQQFTWNSDGTPNFGVPAKTGMPQNLPAEN